MDYLKDRGLSDETIRQFGLGYAGKYSDTLYRYLKNQNISDELLRESGLFNVDEKRGMYDKFWNRVMFPHHGCEQPGNRFWRPGDGRRKTEVPELPRDPDI